MLSHYLKIALRLLIKEKAYTFTNILGLTLGITCSLFIYLWVQDELAYNQWPQALDRVHYVHTRGTVSDGGVRLWVTTPQPLVGVLREHYPSIDRAAIANWGQTNAFKRGEEHLEMRGVSASPELFDIFSIPFIQGGHEPMFEAPNTIAISENMAEKYFGPGWQTLSVPGKALTDKHGETFTICGVFKDVPEHSTLTFAFVIPYTHYLSTREGLRNWGAFSNRTFVKVNKGYTTATANDNVRNAILDHKPDDSQVKSTLLLQPFSEMYLYGTYEQGDFTGGRIAYVRLMSIAAMLILLLAGINFMNLTTAKSAKRSKETGVRKVLGAFTSTIRRQFIMEAIIMATIAFVLSCTLVALLLPRFNLLVGKDIGVDFFSPEWLAAGLVGTLGLGILSGAYPAFYMASLKPVLSLKGMMRSSKGNVLFRRALIVFQFAIAIMMVAGSIAIYQQVHFIMHKDTGLDRENVITIRLADMGVTGRYEVYKQQLRNMPGIEAVTTTSRLPIEINNSTRGLHWEGKDESLDYVFFYMLETDPDFMATFNVRLLEGRSFDWDLRSDTAHYLVNQMAAKLMGMENPVGAEMTCEGKRGTVIGIVEDFHMKSLREPIEPLIIRYDAARQGRAMIRAKEGQIQAALASLEALHKQYMPDRAFAFDFLDDMYNNQYKSEQLAGRLTFYFTVMAIVISVLGLLGLVTFNTEAKTREIGIRKVLGASVMSIVRLLGTESVVLVAIAFAVGALPAYLVIRDWLEGFAYHVELSVWLFLLAGTAALLIALVTIAHHSIRSALRNPVEALKAE